MRYRKSDGGVVPEKACNATGGKAITTITALWGEMHRNNNRGHNNRGHIIIGDK